ncbi:MAG TPA: hypothetical protein VF268_07395, partial [Gammaproteobacteria bacterium]
AMNKKLWLTIPVLLGAVYAGSASAELLIGAKAGAVDYDIGGSDPGVNGSFRLGFEVFDLVAADIAVEAEVSTSLTDGEIGGADASLDTTGVYASLITAGPVYFIGRVGYVDAEVDIGGTTFDDSGTSMGAGIGISTAGLRWEIEYTTFEVENVDINYITLGLSF